MTQTYPARLPSTDKVTDGTALYSIAATDPGSAAYSAPDWNPKAWANKATNHPAGDPDFVIATKVTKACNMPY